MSTLWVNAAGSPSDSRTKASCTLIPLWRQTHPLNPLDDFRRLTEDGYAAQFN